MRVISQDGTKDFPYDSSSAYVYTVCINGRIYVRMQLFGGYDDSVDVAYYSTEAKAQKAMEMLREEYGKHFFSKGWAMATANSYVPPFAFIPPKVFQFPQDEDVEV